MHGQKNRATRPGELDFHLLGERDAAGMKHDDEWRRHRAEELAKRRTS